MNTEELKQIQISRQYLTNKANKESVIKNLCGIQCQFFSYAVHSLAIRCNEEISKDFSRDHMNGNIAGTWKRKNKVIEIKCFREITQVEKDDIKQAANSLWGDIKAIKYLLC